MEYIFTGFYGRRPIVITVTAENSTEARKKIIAQTFMSIISNHCKMMHDYLERYDPAKSEEEKKQREEILNTFTSKIKTKLSPSQFFDCSFYTNFDEEMVNFFEWINEAPFQTRENSEEVTITVL